MVRNWRRPGGGQIPKTATNFELFWKIKFVDKKRKSTPGRDCRRISAVPAAANFPIPLRILNFFGTFGPSNFRAGPKNTGPVACGVRNWRRPGGGQIPKTTTNFELFWNIWSVKLATGSKEHRMLRMRGAKLVPSRRRSNSKDHYEF